MSSSFSGLFAKVQEGAQKVTDDVNARLHRHEQQSNPDDQTKTSSGLSFGDLKQQLGSFTAPAHVKELQLAITASRSTLDGVNSLARSEKRSSKALLDLSATHGSGVTAGPAGDELKDGTLIFYVGNALETYGNTLSQARTALKDIREYELKLNDKRDRRQKVSNQLTAMQKQKNPDHARVESLQQELKTHERDDAPEEASVLALKRRKIQEGFERDFDGLRRLGESLALIAGHGKLLLDGLDQPLPAGEPYARQERTAAISHAAEQAVQSWTAQNARIPLPTLPTVERSDSRSFRETHKDQLAAVDRETEQGRRRSSSLAAEINMQPVALSPRTSNAGLPSPPTLRPVPEPGAAAEILPSPPAGPQPTVAETGAPIVGTGGPSSGQLKPRPTLESIPSATSTTAVLGDSAPQDKVEPTPSAVDMAKRVKEAEHQKEVAANFDRLQKPGDEPPSYS